MKDRFLCWLSHRLPVSLVYWCGIRIWSNATTGQWSAEEAPAVKIDDALLRWVQTHPKVYRSRAMPDAATEIHSGE